jgi:hypothetical protein
MLLHRSDLNLSEKIVIFFFAFFGKIENLQNLLIFEKIPLNFAQSLMKICRNFANIFGHVENS